MKRGRPPKLGTNAQHARVLDALIAEQQRRKHGAVGRIAIKYRMPVTTLETWLKLWRAEQRDAVDRNRRTLALMVELYERAADLPPDVRAYLLNLPLATALDLLRRNASLAARHGFIAVMRADMREIGLFD